MFLNLSTLGLYPSATTLFSKLSLRRSMVSCPSDNWDLSARGFKSVFIFAVFAALCRDDRHLPALRQADVESGGGGDPRFGSRRYPARCDTTGALGPGLAGACSTSTFLMPEGNNLLDRILDAGLCGIVCY